MHKFDRAEVAANMHTMFEQMRATAVGVKTADPSLPMQLSVEAEELALAATLYFVQFHETVAQEDYSTAVVVNTMATPLFNALNGWVSNLVGDDDTVSLAALVLKTVGDMFIAKDSGDPGIGIIEGAAIHAAKDVGDA